MIWIPLCHHPYMHLQLHSVLIFTWYKYIVFTTEIPNFYTSHYWPVNKNIQYIFLPSIDKSNQHVMSDLKSDCFALFSSANLHIVFFIGTVQIQYFTDVGFRHTCGHDVVRWDMIGMPYMHTGVHHKNCHEKLENYIKLPEIDVIFYYNNIYYTT